MRRLDFVAEGSLSNRVPCSVAVMRATNATVLAAALALLLAAVGISHPAIRAALLGNWNFTKSVERDNSIYYRLKVRLTYKGEPQNFDIVVGCNVKQTNYMDG
ncbi:hypothetical protein [Bradyrhizobium sp. LVM 105]|nr:hypothetical protein [Bradyrhizobium sp. LVM 105]